MSILCPNELRYLKYDNLKQEARIIANYYHDIIHSYGMDCTYYKMSVDLPPEFEKIIKSNNTLKQAYGYDDDPNFSLSCDLITYTEIDDDIFILDRIGKSNTPKVNFYFDITDFATKFMTKLGQFKEYKFNEVEISGYIDENDKIIFETDINSEIMSAHVKCDFLTALNGGNSINGYRETFNGGSSSAKPIVTIPYNGGNSNPTAYPIKGIATCLVTEHGQPKFSIPVNEYLARSFTYNAENGDVATAAYFKYSINEDRSYTGTLYATVLYYDLKTVSKFAQNIHPEVGDVISLDTSFGPQIYEITDSNNQNLTNTGINPLVHKYIWKCEATRRIASHDNGPMSEGMIQAHENLLKETISRNSYSNALEAYPDDSDLIYGGFKGNTYQESSNSSGDTGITWDESISYTNDSIVNIFNFTNGSKLITDGYNLYFKNINDQITKISTFSEPTEDIDKLPINLRYLKADAGNIYFQNILGDYIKLVGSSDMSDYNIDIANISYDNSDLNSTDMNFYKFSNCKTILFASQFNLFAKLENNDEFIVLA